MMRDTDTSPLNGVGVFDMNLEFMDISYNIMPGDGYAYVGCDDNDTVPLFLSNASDALDSSRDTTSATSTVGLDGSFTALVDGDKPTAEGDGDAAVFRDLLTCPPDGECWLSASQECKLIDEITNTDVPPLTHPVNVDDNKLSLSDQQLQQLSTSALNKLLRKRKLGRKECSDLKKRRRTLKNRGYARKCRAQRMRCHADFEQRCLQLEKENKLLRNQPCKACGYRSNATVTRSQSHHDAQHLTLW